MRIIEGDLKSQGQHHVLDSLEAWLCVSLSIGYPDMHQFLLAVTPLFIFE